MPLTGMNVIYGGSFDPPHMGHLFAAVWIKKALKAQAVEIIPTHTHPYKPDLTPFQHRHNMCLKTFQNIGPGIHVSNMEEQLPHPNIMINTLRRYGLCANVALAIGSDLVDSIHQWDSWDEIREKVKIVVIGRHNMEKEIPFESFHYPISISAISSTQIREDASQGKDISGMVVWQVRDYIKKNNLYK